MASFVHLRIHSAYSLSEGAIRMDDIARQALDHLMQAAGLTDTNSLAGSFDFAEKMVKAGIKPIIGCQIDILGSEGETGALVFLAASEEGYQNLSLLSSKAHLESASEELPLLTIAQLSEHNEGLMVLSGGAFGLLGEAFRRAGAEKATLQAEKLARIFEGRFYIELQRHGLEVEKNSEAFFLSLAFDKNLPLIATNECFFPSPDFYRAHDVLLCIAEGLRQEMPHAGGKRAQLSAEHYLKTPEDMCELFEDIPEALENTVALAKRCNFIPQAREPRLPLYHAAQSKEDERPLLVEKAHQGLGERLLGLDDKELQTTYRERLDYELGIIRDVGFSGYFLIIADIIARAREMDIPVGPGRGSGAGSLVAWALRITDIDPIRWGLLFERFLNPERVSMPDFDIDFCQEGRDRVIQYVREIYGPERVAQIITFGTLQARACIRDVGRVISMPYGKVDRACKMIPFLPGQEHILNNLEEHAPALAEWEKTDSELQHLFDHARKLEGLYRHASTHAAGIVISAERLDQEVPLYRDVRSEIPVTQFTMKYIEKAGLVKFDFLGLKTLSIIDYCLKLIGVHSPAPDIDHLPFDDRESFETLCKGETFGLFQLESQGMREVLMRMKPDRFNDLIAAVALYRPGPMENIPNYIARKHDNSKVTFLHEKLRPVLEETYGIPVYQEQVMQMAQILANYTLGTADKLRRAMGKKDAQEMAEQEQGFIEGASQNDITPALARNIFSQMKAFAGYGFNKSHAAAYALVAYQTTWLKTRHPAEFLAASMQFDINNTDRLALYPPPARQAGCEILPPDINKSEAGFSVEPGKRIRYALGAIRNLGQKAMQQIVAERNENGPFRDIFDLINRNASVINRRSLENLLKSGACDSLNPNRKQSYEAINLLLRHGLARTQNDENQTNLFGESNQIIPPPTLPETPDGWTQKEMLQKEAEALGFYLSGHPIENWKGLVDQLSLTPAYNLEAVDKFTHGQKLVLVGILESIRKLRTKQGKSITFLSLSDPTGVFELSLFENQLEQFQPLLTKGETLRAVAQVQKTQRDDVATLRLRTEALDLLEKSRMPSGGDVRIMLESQAPLQSLKAILATHARQGQSRISIGAQTGEKQFAIIDLPGQYEITVGLYNAISALPGVLEVETLDGPTGYLEMAS